MAKTYQGLDADPGTSDSKVPVAVTPTGALDGQSNPLQSQVVTLDIGDGTTPKPAGAANPLPISVSALPLPAGAATEATLASLLTDLAAVLAALQGTLAVSVADGVSITGNVAVTGPLTDAQLRTDAVPVSVESLPLPDGAATEATVNTGLTAIVSALGATLDIAGSVDLAANASTTAATLAQGVKTVASSGTPERLAASATLVESVQIQACKGFNSANTTAVFVGVGSSDNSNYLRLRPWESLTISAPPGKKIDLNQIFIDVATNGDGVSYLSVN